MCRRQPESNLLNATYYCSAIYLIDAKLFEEKICKKAISVVCAMQALCRGKGGREGDDALE